MKRKTQGNYVTVSTVGEKIKAFVPTPLPPVPPIKWTSDLQSKFENASLALGRLDSISMFLPDTSLFLYMYIRKEAVLSSMIEGTQSSLSDLLLFEFDQQPGVPLDDVQEVSNYVAALNYGLEKIKSGFPLSLRLLKGIHKILLAKGRGRKCTPGEFRKSQNWIGGDKPESAIFVPPPADSILDCMGNLEKFIHDMNEKTPVFVKAALIHVQFETIHPFLDGNGRLGRLLITLLLCSENVLKEPMLYLSLYFKTHREQYYKLLNDVRSSGDWERWLEFFADAIVDTANQAVETAKRLMKLSASNTEIINKLKRISGSANMVHNVMLQRPMASPNWIQEQTNLSPATVNACLRELESIGILKEITGQKRNRVYSYVEYINILNQGIEPTL